jgi:glycosyltransferase involved in cell wall biosynthesis
MVDGVINVVHNYAMRLNDDEYEVIVFCPKPQDKNYKDNFPYKVVRAKSVKIFFLDYSLPLPKLDRAFKRALKDTKLDIVHIHSPFTIAKMGVKYAKKHNIPVVASMHSQFKQDFYRATRSNFMTNLMLKYIMKVFNACDELYTVNDRMTEIFYEYGTKKRAKVLRNATDFEPVKDEKAACDLVNETYHLSPDETVFIFVGRINALKNIYFLADALTYLKDKHYKMLFVGEGQDMENMKLKVKECHLEDNVIFTGRVTDRTLLSSIYCRAKLKLFPSLYDASSLVQVEAASQKTPVVFVEGAATASTVIDNVNGFIAKATPQEYAKRIEEILSDEELYQKVREGALRDLYISWDQAVAHLKEEYKKQIAIKQASIQKEASSTVVLEEV